MSREEPLAMDNVLGEMLLKKDTSFQGRKIPAGLAILTNQTVMHQFIDFRQK